MIKIKNSDFVHLHVHDQYSKLDGVGTAEDYVRRAKVMGFKAIALTNHGNIDGLLKLQKACVIQGIKPIFGCESYIVPNLQVKIKGEKRGHICLFVKNEIGWKNLVKMLTIANLDGFYYKPRIDFDLLLYHMEGLIISSACASSFLKIKGGIEFLEIVVNDNEIEHNENPNLFLEIMPLMLEDQIAMNELNMILSEKYRIPLIATNDCHYPLPGDYIAQEVLLAIQNKAKWNDKDRWKFSINDLYLKSVNDMIDSFKNQKCVEEKVYEKAMYNTQQVADLCDFQLQKSQVFLPLIRDCDEGIENEFKYLRALCEEGFTNKIKDHVKMSNVYRQRFEYELEIIKQLGFMRYFLIVWELISWCKKKDIFIGPGRGSVSGSLVAYLLNITDVDPLKYGLMFERFISPTRPNLPDIDVDVEDTQREKVKQHLKDFYGEYNVANVSTFLQMKSRMVLRDVSRVFEVPINEVDFVAKTIDEDLMQGLDSTMEGLLFKVKYPQVVSIAQKLEGQIRSGGQHAAAIIISNHDLRDSDKCNLLYAKEKILAVNWDKYDAEEVGMLKLDLLGLSNLSMMKEIRNLLRARKIDVNFNAINLEEESTLEEFNNGHCVGCFQFNTYGLRKLCIDAGVNDFYTLVIITAIYRPASLRCGMVDEFVIRKNNGYEYTHTNRVLQNILSKTYGIIVFQEQVMKIAHKIAGFSLHEADIFRKVLDKNDPLAIVAYEKIFIDGCIKQNTLDKYEAKQLWEEIRSHGGYGFNEAHAVAYTILSYMNMWLKVHYPTEFMCANLTYAAENKKEELMDEVLRLGLKLQTPKAGVSKAIKWVALNKTLYAPFITIKGIGEKYALEAEKMQKKEDGFYETMLTSRLKNLLIKAEVFSNE